MQVEVATSTIILTIFYTGSDESANGASDIEIGSSNTRRPASARVNFGDIYAPSNRNSSGINKSADASKSCCTVS